MVISHLNTHGRVDLAEWHGDSAMWIERTQLHQPICSLACNISNHRIRVFLQYIFALPALGFYYNQMLKQPSLKEVTEEGIVMLFKPSH